MTDTQDQNYDPETGARDIIDLSAPTPPANNEAVGQPNSGSDSEAVGESTPVSNSEAVDQEKRVLKDLSEVEVSNVTQDVIAALKTVYDPEIPVDIYELGLIYRVDFDPATDEKGAKITVDMTLTAPGCPVAGEMPGWVEDAILTVNGIDEVSVNMTFEPPWSPERMSDEAKLELGWM